ncbi:MAG: zinc-dependent metalloprotease [Planctomycetaceae bacterium]|nr:zinc-dependent metalloprotease [Planctomycetaceae bacterium]
MSLTRKLFVERLEDRRQLAALAAPWPEIGQLTLSFAPDGTQVGNQTSNLFSALDPPLAVDVWQLQILRAVQTWADESNINIGLVDDGGQPFNSLGFKQGDLRFGDVRIGAFPMGQDALAVANPYDPFVVNTWVGDIFLNSDYKFDIAGTSGGYDLFSVMLHESGHIFGLGHSTDPLSPMFPQFQQTQAHLTAADIATLREIYGTRKPDAFDSRSANDTLVSATQFPLEMDGDGELEADVTSLQDIDVYRIDIPEGTPTIDLSLLAHGKSLLVGRLSLLDATGQVVTTVAASDPRMNDVSLSFDTHGVGGAYYVQVESAVDDVFGIGAYELEFGSEAYESVEGEPSAKTSDDHQEMTAADLRQAELLATTPGYVEHTYYESETILTNAHPEWMYRVRSVDLGPDLTNVFTVIVDTYGSPNVHVAIYDEYGQVVQAQVLAETEDEIALQVSGVLSNRDYFVRVFGEDYTEDAEVEVEVDFAQDSSHWEQLVTGTLAAGEAEAWQTLQVNEAQAFHWSLAGSDWSLPQETGARLTVFDANGNAIYTLSAADGATRSGDVFLAVGTYTVRFDRGSGDLQTPLLYKLSGLSLSEQLGPQLRDTIREPVDTQNHADAHLSAFWTPGVTVPATNVAFLPTSENGIVSLKAESVWSLLPTGKIDLPREASRAISPSNDSRSTTALGNDGLTAVRDAGAALQASGDQASSVSNRVSASDLRAAHNVVLRRFHPSAVPVATAEDGINESGFDTTDHESETEPFFAASLATDPALMLAAIGGVAWELALRQHLGPTIGDTTRRVVQALQTRVRASLKSRR